MNIRVVEEDGVSLFVMVCNACGKPINDAAKGVCRWFEDSGHIVLSHDGKCDKYLQKQVGKLPGIDFGLMLACVAGNLGIESRSEWVEIWDENIGTDDEEEEVPENELP